MFEIFFQINIPPFPKYFGFLQTHLNYALALSLPHLYIISAFENFCLSLRFSVCFSVIKLSLDIK